MSVWLLLAAAVCAAPPEANPAPERPGEEEMFGESSPPDPKPNDQGWEDLDGPRPTPGLGDLLGYDDDPLAIGGLLYLRLQGFFTEEGGVEEQRLMMPNLVDLYLDARPDPHVRGFVSGRLTYDPTIASGSTNLFGQKQEPLHILLDQLWLKTDIANAVYLTVGQQRVKWGSSRIWNPTDFLNDRKLNPLALFDERTGIPAVKVHVPIESRDGVGANLYAFLLVRDVTTFEDLAGAGRVEVSIDRGPLPMEIALSAMGGNHYKTSVGLDVSAGVWDLDLHAEIAWTDEVGEPHFVGDFSFEPLTLPETQTRGHWYTRVSAGVEYAFKPIEDDLMIVGAEYFYNALGYRDPGLYPWLIAQGAFQPFYLGEHYLAVYWAYPGPGDWDEGSLGFSTLGNLSDLSFVTRVNLSWEVHRNLTLELFAMFHYGRPGGELRFELDTPEIPAIPGIVEEAVPAIHVPIPLMELGLHLRAVL